MGDERTADAPDFQAADQAVLDGADMELDSSGVGVAGENADGLSPTAEQSPLDRQPAATSTPAERRRARDERADDDEETDEDVEHGAAPDRRAGTREDGDRGRRRPSRSRDARERTLTRKIDELTAERRTLERDIERRRQELSTLDRGTPPAGTGQPSARADRGAAPSKIERPKRPKWSEFEKAGKKWEEFEAAEDQYHEQLESYFEAKATTGTTERLSQVSRTVAARQAEDAHQSRITRAREKYEDFDDVVAELEGLESKFIHDLIYVHDHGDEIIYWAGQNRDLADVLADLPLTHAMFDGLRAASNPVAVLEYLAEHTNEALRISRLPSSPAQYKALGALEARLDSGAQQDERGTPRAAQRRPAAPPLSHRAGRRSGAPVRNADSEPVDDYVARRQREERDKRLSNLGLRTA